MKQEDCYQFGEVIKTHGLKGELSIKLDVSNPQEYQELESMFVEVDQTLVPFFVSKIQINGTKALIKLEDIDTIEQASEIAKCKLYLPLSFLPELAQDEYFFHDLIDCTIQEGTNIIGVVESIIELNGNNLMSINKNGKEILIPINDEIIIKVALSEKLIQVALPEGLLDLYL